MKKVIFDQNLYHTNYNCDEKEIEEYLQNALPEKTLTDDEANTCEGKFTIDECYQAVIDMKLNKSPGLDGLTVEFYVKFWNIISHLVINSLNEGYDKGQLSTTQKQSVLSLIYKKGDAENLENWRPISLLSTDYKLAARVLATRFQNTLPNIISLDQQGYLKNRYIGYNIRQIQDIIEYTEALNIDGAILFLDFKRHSIQLNGNLCLQS